MKGGMTVHTGAYVPRMKRMSAVGSAFDEMFFSQEDQELAKRIRSKMSAGELSLPEAHTQMEAIRARYNYSGGADGSGYRALAKTVPEYRSRYDAQKQQALQELNREPFSYDAERDPLYVQLRAQYAAAGKQAMDDTVAKVAARTGGLASSYAAKAGQDAYNAYAEKAQEKIPELEERAYRRYRQEGEDRKDAVALLRALDAEEYTRWNYRQRAQRDEERDAQERTYTYGKDALESAYREEKDAAAQAYRAEKDAADQAYRAEKDEKEERQNAQKNARKDLEAHLAAGGDWRTLPPEVTKAAGYSEAQLEQLAAGYRKNGAAAAKTALQQTIYRTGYRPTDAELAAAGMRREEADQWAAAYAAKLPQARSAGGGGRVQKKPEETEKPEKVTVSPQYEHVVKIANKYNRLENAFAYLDRCVREGYITDDERRRIKILEFGQDVNAPTEAGRFDAALDDLSFLLRKGGKTAAQQAAKRLKEQGLTEKQAQQLEALLKQFGIET